jgi:hypothetical protein
MNELQMQQVYIIVCDIFASQSALDSFRCNPHQQSPGLKGDVNMVEFPDQKNIWALPISKLSLESRETHSAGISRVIY